MVNLCRALDIQHQVALVAICGRLARLEIAGNDRWQVMRPQRLSVRRWDDELWVYDDHSGDTHIFEDLAGQVLERLHDTSAGIDELSLLGAASAGKDVADSHCAAQIHDVIELLCDTGIVKPVLR
jgi:PqqD family protein of HPr-rel-A system